MVDCQFTLIKTHVSSDEFSKNTLKFMAEKCESIETHGRLPAYSVIKTNVSSDEFSKNKLKLMAEKSESVEPHGRLPVQAGLK